MITYLPNGWSKRVNTISEIVFDNKGRRCSEELRNSKSGVIYISLANCYDDDGNLIETRRNELQTNYTYHDSGELLSEKHKNNFLYDKSYTYTKHDANGNWTERIVTLSDTATQYTEIRDITYYEKANLF